KRRARGTSPSRRGCSWRSLLGRTVGGWSRLLGSEPGALRSAVMRLRPALVLAAPAGVLVGHAIGYLAAPGPTGAAALHHGYLALAFSVAVPLAVMASGWAATTGAAADARGATPSDRALPLGPLLLAQWM